LIEHIKQVRQDDDGNGDAQKPKQDAVRSIKLPAAEPPKNGVPPYPKSGEVKSRLRDRREQTVPIGVPGI
jgi:hypothetical protein